MRLSVVSLRQGFHCMMGRGRIYGLAVFAHALSVAKSTEAVEIAGQRNCRTCLDREGQASSKEIIAVAIEANMAVAARH